MNTSTRTHASAAAQPASRAIGSEAGIKLFVYVAVGIAANWAMNLLVAVTFQTLVSLLGHAGTFWLYGLVAIGAWIFVYRLVPETKGKSLEQIEAHWRTAKSPRQL